MERMKHWQSYVLIALCVAVNLIGRAIASKMQLPFWLDAIGTLIAAIELGPLGGALVGVIVNLVLSFFNPVNLAYIFVNVAIGMTVGIFYPRNKKFDAFAVVATSVFAGFLAVIISTPLNMHFYEGMTGNIWGDGLITMLSQSINVRWICSLLGEAFVDIPDKTVSVIIAFGLITIFKWLFKSRVRKSGDRGVTE